MSGEMCDRFGPINVISPKSVILNKPGTGLTRLQRVPRLLSIIGPVRRRDLNSAASEVGSTGTIGSG